jgi:type IV secretion system protein VirB2
MNTHNQQSRFSNNVTKSKLGMPLALAAGVGALALMPSIAMAAPWDAAIGAVAGTLQGTLGKGIAIVAVIALGLMAMAGKLEWMTAIKVVIGIVIMFSASQIINWIAPNAGVSDRVAVGSLGATQANCPGVGGVWIPESLEVRLADGTTLNPTRSAYCAEVSSARAACMSSVSNAGLSTDGLRAAPTYRTYTAPTGAAAGACN